MWKIVITVTWGAWLAFAAFVAVSALGLGHDQVRNVVIAWITTVAMTGWWALSRRVVSTQRGWLVPAVGVLNVLLFVLAAGLLVAACTRVFGEGYAVFG